MFVCNVCKTFKNLDINFTDFLLQLSWVRRLVKALPHNIFKARAAQAKCRCYLLFKIECFSALRVGWHSLAVIVIRMVLKDHYKRINTIKRIYTYIFFSLSSLSITSFFFRKTKYNFLNAWNVFISVWNHLFTFMVSTI